MKERERQEREGERGRFKQINGEQNREREREKRDRRYIKRERDGNRWKRWIASERVREKRTERKRWKQMDRE